MLLSKLIEKLECLMVEHGNLDVILEDYEVGNFVEVNSVQVVEITEDQFVMLSDRPSKEVEEIEYLN